VNIAELTLRHQSLTQQASQLRASLERTEVRLSGDPQIKQLEHEITEAHAQLHTLTLRLNDSEQQAEAQRRRLQGRERELMSGRITNPTELMKLNQEVEHLRVGLREAEEEELVLMEEAERRDGELQGQKDRFDQITRESQATLPDLQSKAKHDRHHLSEIEAEREQIWSQLPETWQATYLRVQTRLSNPVAEVAGGQCQGCHVRVTSSGMQALRRGDLMQCDNCGRLLVMA
jgi:predicted  nucleic acid-binding Zn-ribbon protein